MFSEIDIDIVKMLEVFFFHQQHIFRFSTDSRMYPADTNRDTLGRCRLHTGSSQESENKLVRSFNFALHYIDDVLSLNNF